MENEIQNTDNVEINSVEMQHQEGDAVETPVESVPVKKTALQEYLEDMVVIEKKPPVIQVFFSNLKYRLSYTPALIWNSIGSIVCLLGLLFFIAERQLYVADAAVVSSCTLLIIVFAAFLAMFVILLISSIILNIIRHREGKK